MTLSIDSVAKARLRSAIAYRIIPAMRSRVAWWSKDGRSARRWARAALKEFEMSAARRETLLAQLTGNALRLISLAAAGNRHDFAAYLLQAVQRMDSGDVRHKSARMRSYVDVSVQAKALRAFAEYLAPRRLFAGDPVNVTGLVLEEHPDCRPCLIAHAELLLSHAEVDDAIVVIQRALRIQAVCISAQHLLSRAYEAQRKTGRRPGGLDGSDYDLSDKFCPMPFTHLSTGFKGDAFLCKCPAWVPFPVGNILEAETAEEVWNSQGAQEIRRSVHDGDFRYCSPTLCPYIAARKLPLKTEIKDPLLRHYIDEKSVLLDDKPTVVQLNHDPSCNLACPSCRTEIITANAKEQAAYGEAAKRVILPLLRKMNGQCYISGGGEAFASRHFRSILKALNRAEYPGLYLHLITNGQAITAERWRQFPDLPEMIDVLSVSVDAARYHTYERLRPPGKWPVLMENLKTMAEMRRAGSIRRLQLNFVIQEANYRELPEFVRFALSLGSDSIWLQRLTNYGSYDEGQFAAADVSSPAHPQHGELLDILRDPIYAHPAVTMEMLMPILPEVVASDMRLLQLEIADLRLSSQLHWDEVDELRDRASMPSQPDAAP